MKAEMREKDCWERDRERESNSQEKKVYIIEWWRGKTWWEKKNANEEEVKGKETKREKKLLFF